MIMACVLHEYDKRHEEDIQLLVGEDYCKQMVSFYSDASFQISGKNM